jgi:hypothetical protein
LNLERLEYVGKYGFNWGQAITKINLPCLKSVEEGGFSECANLKHI